MVYLPDKGKRIKEMSAGIVAFVLVLEEKLREQINQELLDGENRDGVIGEDHQELLSGIRRGCKKNCRRHKGSGVRSCEEDGHRRYSGRRKTKIKEKIDHPIKGLPNKGQAL